MPTKDITTREEIMELMEPGGEPAIIDFWAPWCGPCRSMAPQYEAAAVEMADADVTFYKLNTQAHPELAQAFNVRSLPTIMAINDGQIQDVIIGAQSGQAILRFARKLNSKSSGEGFLKRLFG